MTNTFSRIEEFYISLFVIFYDIKITVIFYFTDGSFSFY